MIISYSRKFIFIRTRKTASATIENILRSNLAAQDICVSHKKLVDSQTRTEIGMQGESVAGHMTLGEIVPLVSLEFWNESFKFSCERHPYEKAVSLAHFNWLRGENRGKSRDVEFNEYLDRTVRQGSYRGFDHYSIGGKVAVDDFIRFETLIEDLRRIGEYLGISVPAELPQKKVGKRKDQRPAQEVLSNEQRQIVYNHCREEFELFGYAP
jgi:hypothetical protein